MNSAFLRRLAFVVAVSGLAASLPCFPQGMKHGRKYNPPAATAHIVVTVVKKFNDKPMDTVAVMFRASKDGHDTGNMEMRTNSKGEAIMDLIEAGSRVRVQVLAQGYATYATEFNVDANEKDILIKMERPREQVSSYGNDAGKPAIVKPGLQEHIVPKPAPAAASGTGAVPQK